VDKIGRIVVLNTAAFPLPQTKKLPATLSLVRNTWLGSLLVTHCNAFSRGATTMAIKRRPMSKELKAAYMAPYDSPANRIATLRFVQDIPLKPADPGYQIIEATASKLTQFSDTPVLICWGDLDFVFDHHFLAVWEKTWPHAKVHRFEDCGHYVLEDAEEEIGGLVDEFLNPSRPV
jgi:haloalkane dehalogenase